jgi:hypothetical protein
MTIDEINDKIKICQEKINSCSDRLEAVPDSETSMDEYNNIILELDKAIDDLTDLIKTIE